MTGYRDARKRYEIAVAKHALPIDGAPILPNLDKDGPAAEALRNLVLRLESRLDPGSASKAILLTSPERSSGKTVTSLNLAFAFSEMTDGRVLLVESDAAHPSLHRYLMIPPHTVVPPAGHTLGDGDPEFCAVPVVDDRLYVLPHAQVAMAGRTLPRTQLDALMRWARQRFDLILFDGPPLFAASAFQLTRLVDGVVIVARAHMTRKQDFDRLCEELRPEKVLGVVLNDVGEPHRSRSSKYRTKRWSKPPS